ncbi:hypothetical protein BH11MYX2_BH11MYX2_02170 [soil metagenome]
MDIVAADSLARVARQLRGPTRTAKQRADDAYTRERTPLDTASGSRGVQLELLAGASHYDKVIGAIRDAHTSVWIATANVKGMLVEGGAQPGRRRSRTSGTYVSMVSQLDALAAKGVELRMLHGEIPSRPFREEIARHPRLLTEGGLSLARCPRVHLKAVVVDGSLLYLGSANWTGAGLGAKGSGKRNFELGIITDDAAMLDDVQMMFERIWSGAECKGCKLRGLCPGPLDEVSAAPTAKATRAPKRPKRARKPRASR